MGAYHLAGAAGEFGTGVIEVVVQRCGDPRQSRNRLFIIARYGSGTVPRGSTQYPICDSGNSRMAASASALLLRVITGSPGSSPITRRMSDTWAVLCRPGWSISICQLCASTLGTPSLIAPMTRKVASCVISRRINIRSPTNLRCHPSHIAARVTARNIVPRPNRNQRRVGRAADIVLILPPAELLLATDLAAEPTGCPIELHIDR